MPHLMGRPRIYTGNLARHIVSLTRKHNASVAKRILNARRGTSLATKRNVVLVPTPLGISLPTIRKLAHADNVSLRRGRPRKAA